MRPLDLLETLCALLLMLTAAAILALGRGFPGDVPACEPPRLEAHAEGGAVVVVGHYDMLDQSCDYDLPLEPLRDDHDRPDYP